MIRRMFIVNVITLILLNNMYTVNNYAHNCWVRSLYRTNIICTLLAGFKLRSALVTVLTMSSESESYRFFVVPDNLILKCTLGNEQAPSGPG